MSTPVLDKAPAPPGRQLGQGALRLLERNLIIYRRSWILLVSGFFEPVFYLFAIGISLGQDVRDPLPGVSFAAFAAPAMLASSAMNGAIFEAAINFFFKLRYQKTYDAILSTPIEPAEIALGELGWSLVRGGIYAAGFLAVMVALGLMLSPWGWLALPAAIFIGLAFGGVGMAAGTFMRSWQDLDLVTAVTLPLFLFSGTFFELKGVAAWIGQLSPLYHGIELIRSLTLGNIGPAILWHMGFLVALGSIGLRITARRIDRVLKK